MSSVWRAPSRNWHRRLAMSSTVWAPGSRNSKSRCEVVLAVPLLGVVCIRASGRLRHVACRDLRRLVGIVGEPQKFHVVGRKIGARKALLMKPGEKPMPVRLSEEDDREVLDLSGLRERQRLEQLVEGAKAAGEDDEAARVLDEHRLAREEVAKLDAQSAVVVQG